MKNPKDTSHKYEAFSLGNAIFEFNNDEVTIHNFIGKAKKIKIKKDNEIKFQGTKLNLVTANQDSIVLRINDNIENYITLIPYPPSNFQLSEDDFKSSQWKVTFDKNPQNPLSFHFLNSTNLISVYDGVWHGYASFSDWKIRRSGQYSVLQVSDQENLDEYVFYPFAKKGENILASISHIKNSRYPILSEIEILKTTLPPSEELSEIKNKLAGKWTFKQFYNLDELGPIDSLISLDFSIDLVESGVYFLENKIASIIGGRNSDFSQNQNGKWILSETGTYFIMHPENGSRKYISIHELTEDILTIDFSYRFEERSSFSTRIIMKKTD
ncbi:hypothetical protein JYB64_03200 [Algoriphagus aestuarii]|nr:hypothetical protein [Algoriphagus aestuarii]